MVNKIISEKATYYSKKNISLFLEKLLYYANCHAKYVVHLDGNDIAYLYDSFPKIVAFGSNNSLECNETKNAFKALELFCENKNNTIFGFLGYNLKNDLEHLQSTKEISIKFPDLFFFEPDFVFYFDKNGYYVDTNVEYDIVNLLKIITNFEIPIKHEIKTKIMLQQSKKDYFESLDFIKSKITSGDIYEANYCIENLVETDLHPVSFFINLAKISPMPFGSFVKYNEKYIICASPERFLKNESNLLISQPIKGTAKRGKTAIEDLEIIQKLQNSEKERAENTMIVDLVRNDLSHTAKDGSVEVKELCKVCTFENVHQMISTITATKSKNFSYLESLKHCFPMGSMTGAPKINAMQWIDFIEHTNRGIFSGSVGYITPTKDFDFNVIIRTLVYDDAKKIASYHVGSAITIDSDNESEFLECAVKASAIEKLLQIE